MWRSHGSHCTRTCVFLLCIARHIKAIEPETHSPGNPEIDLALSDGAAFQRHSLLQQRALQSSETRPSHKKLSSGASSSLSKYLTQRRSKNEAGPAQYDADAYEADTYEAEYEEDSPFRYLKSPTKPSDEEGKHKASGWDDEYEHQGGRDRDRHKASAWDDEYEMEDDDDYDDPRSSYRSGSERSRGKASKYGDAEDGIGSHGKKKRTSEDWGNDDDYEVEKYRKKRRAHEDFGNNDDDDDDYDDGRRGSRGSIRYLAHSNSKVGPGPSRSHSSEGRSSAVGSIKAKHRADDESRSRGKTETKLHAKSSQVSKQKKSKSKHGGKKGGGSSSYYTWQILYMVLLIAGAVVAAVFIYKGWPQAPSPLDPSQILPAKDSGESGSRPTEESTKDILSAETKTEPPKVTTVEHEAPQSGDALLEPEAPSNDLLPKVEDNTEEIDGGEPPANPATPAVVIPSPRGGPFVIDSSAEEASAETAEVPDPPAATPVEAKSSSPEIPVSPPIVESGADTPATLPDVDGASPSKGTEESIQDKGEKGSDEGTQEIKKKEQKSKSGKQKKEKQPKKSAVTAKPDQDLPASQQRESQSASPVDKVLSAEQEDLPPPPVDEALTAEEANSGDGSKTGNEEADSTKPTPSPRISAPEKTPEVVVPASEKDPGMKTEEDPQERVPLEERLDALQELKDLKAKQENLKKLEEDRNEAIASLAKVEAEQAKAQEVEEEAERAFKRLPYKARSAAVKIIGQDHWASSSWQARLTAAEEAEQEPEHSEKGARKKGTRPKK